jgi:HAMP domain-containing protein
MKLKSAVSLLSTSLHLMRNANRVHRAIQNMPRMLILPQEVEQLWRCLRATRDEVERLRAEVREMAEYKSKRERAMKDDMTQLPTNSSRPSIEAQSYATPQSREKRTSGHGRATAPPSTRDRDGLI